MFTITDVNSRIEQFDKENGPIEWLLTQLFRQFRSNADLSEVLLKTKVLNLLYSTRIGDVNTVASHIVGLGGIDALLSTGSSDAVSLIANVQIKYRNFCFYSFATKYCSWHNPAAYPIYDKHVDTCLWFYKKQRLYNKQDPFATFLHQDLWNYPTFLKVVSAFRGSYGLDSFNFKQLDKFLFYHGEELLSQGENASGKNASGKRVRENAPA